MVLLSNYQLKPSPSMLESKSKVRLRLVIFSAKHGFFTQKFKRIQGQKNDYHDDKQNYMETPYLPNFLRLNKSSNTIPTWSTSVAAIYLQSKNHCNISNNLKIIKHNKLKLTNRNSPITIATGQI